MSFTHCGYCGQPWVNHGTVCAVEQTVSRPEHYGAPDFVLAPPPPRADLAALRTLNRELADALEECREIIDSEELLGVFQYAGVHGYTYTGKSVDTKKLAALIARAREADAERKGEKP